MTLGIQVRLLIAWHVYVKLRYEVYIIVFVSLTQHKITQGATS